VSKKAKRKAPAKPERNYVEACALVEGPGVSIIPRVKKGPKSAKRDKVSPQLKKLMPQAEAYVAPKAPMSYVKRSLGQGAKRVKGLVLRNATRAHVSSTDHS